MEELIDMIVTDENASDISDKIKEILYAKSAENLESLKPYVATSIFDDGVEED
jgi:hypothetical protein